MASKNNMGSHPFLVLIDFDFIGQFGLRDAQFYSDIFGLNFSGNEIFNR